jgi:hypothetical protein
MAAILKRDFNAGASGSMPQKRIPASNPASNRRLLYADAGPTSAQKTCSVHSRRDEFHIAASSGHCGRKRQVMASQPRINDAI